MSDHDFQSQVLGKLDDFCERLDRLEVLLTGDGEPEKGLIVRVDRLEQSEKRQETKASEHRGLLYTAVGAAIASLVGAAITFIH